MSRALSVVISCLCSAKNLRRALYLAVAASHYITLVLKCPLNSRVVTLRVFDFRRPLGSLLEEALTDPLRELGRAVTGMVLSLFVSLGRLISRLPRLLLAVVIFISSLLLELRMTTELNSN